MKAECAHRAQEGLRARAAPPSPPHPPWWRACNPSRLLTSLTLRSPHPQDEPLGPCSSRFLPIRGVGCLPEAPCTRTGRTATLVRRGDELEGCRTGREVLSARCPAAIPPSRIRSRSVPPHSEKTYPSDAHRPRSREGAQIPSKSTKIRCDPMRVHSPPRGARGAEDLKVGHTAVSQHEARGGGGAPRNHVGGAP